MYSCTIEERSDTDCVLGTVEKGREDSYIYLKGRVSVDAMLYIAECYYSGQGLTVRSTNAAVKYYIW